MQQGHLFLVGYSPLSDGEIEQVLARAVASSGRLPRCAEAVLLELTAAHLVNELRLMGLEIVRPAGSISVVA
jgi:hypothetical protein